MQEQVRAALGNILKDVESTVKKHEPSSLAAAAEKDKALRELASLA